MKAMNYKSFMLMACRLLRFATAASASFILVTCSLVDKIFVNVSGSCTVDSVFSGSSKALNSKAIIDLADYEVVIHKGANVLNTKAPPQRIKLDSDGNFEFNLFAGHEFVAFLVNPSEPFRKVVGILGIGTGENEYWEAIDTDLLIDDLFMGQFSSSDTDEILVSQFSIGDLAGGITDIDKAMRSASWDNVVRLLKNAVNNDVFAGAGFELKLTIPGGLVANQWAYPDDYEVSMSYGISIGDEAWRDAPLDAAYIVAPADLQYQDEPLIPAGTPISPSSGGIGNDGYGFGPFDDMAAGYWQLYYYNELYMEIDITGSSPLENGKLIQPVPAMKLNTETGTGRVTSIEFLWYLVDDTGEYAPITETDLQVLEELLEKWKAGGTAGFPVDVEDLIYDPDKPVEHRDNAYSYRTNEIEIPNEVYLTSDNPISVAINSGVWGLGGFMTFEFHL